MTNIAPTIETELYELPNPAMYDIDLVTLRNLITAIPNDELIDSEDNIDLTQSLAALFSYASALMQYNIFCDPDQDPTEQTKSTMADLLTTEILPAAEALNTLRVFPGDYLAYLKH